MEQTGVDFLLEKYVDKIVVDKTLNCLLTNRKDIEKHLRDTKLYKITNNFIENTLEKCDLTNSRLITELSIIFDIIVNTTYKQLISMDDTNFQLFVLILNSTLVLDIEEKINQIFINGEESVNTSQDSQIDDQQEVLNSILDKMSNNLVKDLDNREINPDVYEFNLRNDLIKIINQLVK